MNDTDTCLPKSGLADSAPQGSCLTSGVTVALNYNYGGRIATVPLSAVAPARDDTVTTWPPGALRSESNSACTGVSVGDTVR